MSREPLLVPETLGNNFNLTLPINTQTASIQVDPSLGVHELVLASDQMLAAFLFDKRFYQTLGNTTTRSLGTPNSISSLTTNLMSMNTQPASVQVDLVTARREMLNNLFMEINFINTIIIFLDITGRRPWCGRVGLKWLLSEQQQKYLAQLACHLLFNVPPPVATPVLFNGYGHIEETNFDEVLAAFLSKGVKECGKYVFTNNVSKLAVSCIIASHIVRGFMMIFP